jgi:hypothetical protein
VNREHCIYIFSTLRSFILLIRTCERLCMRKKDIERFAPGDIMTARRISARHTRGGHELLMISDASIGSIPLSTLLTF